MIRVLVSAVAGMALAFTMDVVLADTVTVIGVGTRSCRDWEADQFGEPKELMKQWIIGYLSGYAASTGQDILDKTTARAIWSEMDRRCRLRPDEMLANIALKVAQSLRD